jgi:hypothetical protein
MASNINNMRAKHANKEVCLHIDTGGTVDILLSRLTCVSALLGVRAAPELTCQVLIHMRFNWTVFKHHGKGNLPGKASMITLFSDPSGTNAFAIRAAVCGLLMEIRSLRLTDENMERQSEGCGRRIRSCGSLGTERAG